MYAVSNDYKTAIAAASRADRITGTITLADLSTVTITDAIVEMGSLTLEDFCVPGSDIDVGAVSSSVLRVGLLIADDLSGATIEPIYGIDIGGGVYEDVPLGKFWVVQCPRENNVVKVTAADAMLLLTDPVGTPPASGSPYDYLAYIATTAGITLANSEAAIDAMPNGGLTITYPAESEIKSLRDLLMWVACLLAGFAWFNRDGSLEIRHMTGASARTITDACRDNTNISDITKTVTAVTTTVNGTSYEAAATPDDGGTVAMDDNPLIRAASAGTINTVLSNMLGELDGISYRPFQTELIRNDPALEPGDLVTLTGGVAGVGTACLITHNYWAYRGKQALTGAGADSAVSGVLTQEGKKILRLDRLVADIVEAALFRGQKIELGGLDNGNGEMEIQDASGNVIVEGNKDGEKIHLPSRSAGSLTVPFSVYDDQFSQYLFRVIATFPAGGYLDALFTLLGYIILARSDGEGGTKTFIIDPSAGDAGSKFGQLLWGSNGLLFTADGKLYHGDNEIWDAGNSPKSGTDGTLITGTPGTSGNLPMFNADGDIVDGLLAASAAPKCVNRQNDTSNATVSNQLIQHGWGYIQGNGSNSAATETVTFPVAFDDIPIIEITAIGSVATSGGTPANAGVFTTAETVFAALASPAVGSFTAAINHRDATALANTKYYGYMWRAVGTKARS